jgi:lipopolysaccharide transport system ATP-binding protein
LLEVGTGFNPELTGRENIYLNGAILGMTKKEISSKLDEIIDFSGCERYIDTPAKRYSSGMTVRLAFAVAAFLEPEILVIDEVLAVGDAEFQKKAIGKMQDISRSGGRTVLFVSHNMAAVKQLCTKAIVLENGVVVFEGKPNDGIDYYLQNNKAIQNLYISELISAVKQTKITYIAFIDENENVRNEFRFDEQIKIKLEFNVTKEHMAAVIGFKVKDKNETVIFSSEISIEQIANLEGKQKIEIILPKSILVPNSYSFNFAIHFPNFQIIELLEDIITFDIIETGTVFNIYKNVDYGCVILDSTWLSKN